MNRYYPAFLDLRDKPCLVVGTGDLCEEKAATLERAGARVSRSVGFDEEMARDHFLIVADVDEALARTIWEFGGRHRIFVNIVDKPRFCSFILPAVLHRGDLQIAVSTGGASPALAGWIRRRLEQDFGSEFAVLLEELGRTRQSIRRRFSRYSDRKFFYYRLFENGILESARTGGEAAVRERLERAVEEFEP